MAWVEVMPSAELAVGGHRRLDLGGQPVLLARLADGCFAVHDTCLHRGASLSSFPLEGDEAVCHLHFWRFNIRSGACVQVPSIHLRRYAVKEEQGSVYVEI